MDAVYHDGEHSGVDLARAAVAQGRTHRLGVLLRLPPKLIERAACGVRGQTWAPWRLWSHEVADIVFDSHIKNASTKGWRSFYVEVNREFRGAKES